MQREGCEQGDPLAPALFALGQHGALCQAPSALRTSERLLAFLDDLYVLTARGRAREARDTMVQAVQEGCGILSHDARPGCAAMPEVSPHQASLRWAQTSPGTSTPAQGVVRTAKRRFGGCIFRANGPGFF